RNAQQGISGSHEQRVEPASEVAGRDTDDRRCKKRNDHRRQAHGDRHAACVEKPRSDVATDLVRPEDVLRRGCLQHVARCWPQREVAWHEHRAEHDGRENEEQRDGADDRKTVAEERSPCAASWAVRSGRGGQRGGCQGCRGMGRGVGRGRSAHWYSTRGSMSVYTTSATTVNTVTISATNTRMPINTGK